MPPHGFQHRRVSAISGGQRQRVAIARALVYKPDLLLLDEPMAALDKKLREEMQIEFRRIQQELGVTTINVTHDQREALVMSDRIIVLNDGCVQQIGRPQEVYRHPSNSFVANFIGQTNVIECTVVNYSDSHVTINLFGKQVPIPFDGETSYAGLKTGNTLQYALRAEQIQIGPLTSQMYSVDVSYSAIVVKAAYEGDRSLCAVSIKESIPLLKVIDTNIDNEYHSKDELSIGWKVEDMVLIH